MKIKPKVDVIKLEKEFQDLIDSVGTEIEGKLEQAKLLLKEAVKLSEENGVPFYSPVSILGETYIPSSFVDKFKALNVDSIAELTGIPAEDLEQNRYGRGWNHSQVC